MTSPSQISVNNDGFDENGFHRPSKSHVKRKMHALLDLGKQLIDLSADRLQQLPLEERLYEAICEAQRTTSREGRRRQTHFVGKLMRDAPADVIRKQLDIWKNGSREDTFAMHQLEKMRDRLIANDDMLTKLLADCSNVNVQNLRSLIRAARKESLNNAALLQRQEPQRKHYRALFQFLKTVSLK